MKINKIILPCLTFVLMLPIFSSIKTTSDNNVINITKKMSSRGAHDFEWYTNFEVNDCTYVDDYEETQTYCGGSSIKKYNTLDLWTAIYSRYDNDKDYMYYYVLAYPEMWTNDKDYGTFIKDFRIVAHHLKINISSKFWSADPYVDPNSVRLGRIAPTEEGNTSCTKSYGISLGVEVGKEGAQISGGVSFEVGSYSDNVILALSKNSNEKDPYYSEKHVEVASSDTNRYMSFLFDFKNKFNRDINNEPPFRRWFQRSVMTEFRVTNYTALKARSTRVYFNIDAEASSQKFNIISQTGHDVKTSYLHREYCIEL